jgi:RimJ/RimL family protein N-acetyltransferase
MLKETNRVIGIVTIKKYKDSESKAEISFWIGVPYWGKGIMTEALKQAVSFAFKKLGIDFISAWTYESNAASSKVMEKCGFVFAGKDKDVYYKFGQWHNRLNYSILKQKWLELVNKQSTTENE